MGINPGTRYLGLAVFQDWNLVDWRIKSLEGKWSKKKIGKTIEAISERIECFNLNTLAIKKLHSSRASKNLKTLVSKIKILARSRKIKVYEYSIKDLERFFLSEKRSNKKTLAQKMAADYPFLTFDLHRMQARKNLYYLRMFEAVALGAACFHKLNR